MTAPEKLYLLAAHREKQHIAALSLSAAKIRAEQAQLQAMERKLLELMGDLPLVTQPGLAGGLRDRHHLSAELAQQSHHFIALRQDSARQLADLQTQIALHDKRRRKIMEGAVAARRAALLVAETKSEAASSVVRRSSL